MCIFKIGLKQHKLNTGQEDLKGGLLKLLDKEIALASGKGFRSQPPLSEHVGTKPGTTALILILKGSQLQGEADTTEGRAERWKGTKSQAM